MSAEHEEMHTGPVKTPSQMLVAASLGFLAPVFIILGLVAYFSSDAKTSPGATQTEQRLEQRIQKVGAAEVRDEANRVWHSGEQVYKAQCMACHDAGVAGAPKLGDAGAWGARLGGGFDTLVEHAIKGKGAMPPQAGGQFADLEIARAVAFMGNAVGGKFEEPAAPAKAENPGS